MGEATRALAKPTEVSVKAINVVLMFTKGLVTTTKASETITEVLEMTTEALGATTKALEAVTEALERTTRAIAQAIDCFPDIGRVSLNRHPECPDESGVYRRAN
ncbi:MAG: hypothetical protein ACI9CU_002153 [Polaribacter sp.]|jgi:hypothetical protein